MTNTAHTDEVLPFDVAPATTQGAAPKKKAPKVSDDLKAIIAQAVADGIKAGLAAFAAQAPVAAPPQARPFPFQGAPPQGNGRAFQGAPVRQQAPKKAAQGRPPVDPNRPRSVDAAAFAKAQQDTAKAAGHDALTVRNVYKQAYNEALAAQGLPKRYLDV